MGRHSGPPRNEGHGHLDSAGADSPSAAPGPLNGHPSEPSWTTHPAPTPDQVVDPGTGTWPAPTPVPPPVIPEPSPPAHATGPLPAIDPTPTSPGSYIDASGLPQQMFVYEFDESALPAQPTGPATLPPPPDGVFPAAPPQAPPSGGFDAPQPTAYSPAPDAAAPPTSPAGNPFDATLLQPLPPAPPSSPATGPERLSPVAGPTPPTPPPPPRSDPPGPTMLRRAELPAQPHLRTAPTDPGLNDTAVNGTAHPYLPPPPGPATAPQGAVPSSQAFAPPPSAPDAPRTAAAPPSAAQVRADVPPAPAAGPATTGTLPRTVPTSSTTTTGSHRRIAAARSDPPEENARQDKVARKDLPWVVRHSTWRESLLLIAVVLVVSTTIKMFLVQAFFVPSGSMEDTIKIGDRVVVDKLTPWFGATPQRGEVIVFKDPGGWLDPSETTTTSNPFERFAKDALILVGLLPEDGEGNLIKRVVGVPGDHVVCCDAQKRLMINGVPLSEPYTKPLPDPSDPPLAFDIVVPPGRLWMLGDNRGNSKDSRYHLDDQDAIYDGTIPMSSVVGRADAVVWPIGDMKTLSIPDTFHQDFSKLGTDVPAPTDPATTSVLLAGGYMARRRRRERRIPVELTGFRPERALRPRRTRPPVRRAGVAGRVRVVRRRPTLG